MEGGGSRNQLTTPSLMPVSAHSADNRIIDLQLKITATPEGGRLLGIIQPVWTKAIESEQRLHWLKDMIEKKLVVRDIQHFGENMTEQMRAESSREEELERDTLLDLMKVKYSDEKRYHRECVRVREEIKDWLKKKLGRGKYKTILGKVKKREEKRPEGPITPEPINDGPGKKATLHSFS